MNEDELVPRQLTGWAAETLVLALRRRGLEPNARGEWIQLGVGQLHARFVVSGIHSDRKPVLAFLAAQIRPFVDQEEGIRESVIGIGRTAPEAVENAVEVCLDGLLPPLVSALAPGRGAGLGSVVSSRLEQPDLEAGGTEEWRVFAGPLLATGARRRADARSILEAPFDVLESQDALPVFPRSLPLSWMKLLVVRQDGEVSGECRVNNSPWPVGLDVLARSGWPTRARAALLPETDDDGYFAVRQFVVLLPSARMG
jgi:hypothetical protein